ncbi:MAG TPA: ATP-binding protein, partial [Polyangiaceae bacterium]|nr:ATP-binding protein [Polyangiaceae bacterium]
MSKAIAFLKLPGEVSDFERSYLRRVNRIALWFFVLHLPAFTLIAWLNDTGPLLAALLTTAILIGPLVAQRALDNPRAVSVVYGITAMFMGGVLVHLGQGPLQIEMHFYFFALIAMCAVFANPMVILAAAATVTLHHTVVWMLVPRSVFNYEASLWVVAVHAAFVVLESVASCFIARSFFDNVIGLEKIVQSRTSALDSKNRDMRVLLDNVQQGFLTIDREGHLARERSAVVDTWFGVPTPGASWFDYLTRVSSSFATRTQLAWSAVAEDVMPLEVTLAQMPSQLSHHDVHYRIDYRPIGQAQPFEQYLVIITDITTEVAREEAELERGETLALVNHLLNDRRGLESFFDEAGDMIDVLTNQRSTDPSVIKRLIHTLKGNAAVFGLKSVAGICHALEDSIADEGRLPSGADYDRLLERWARLSESASALLGTRTATVEIDEAQFTALESAARSGHTGAKLLQQIRSLKLEATAKRLVHFQRQAEQIAERLGKGHIRVEIEDNGVRLDPQRWAGFWSAFVHAVRNALDHGIEPEEDRAAIGKAMPGKLILRTVEQGERVVIEIVDDGRGIDWQKVAARANSAGVSAQTREELEQALFVDGVSTAASVTDVSGRGVGMGALLAATKAMDGQLSVRSESHQGTTLHF